MSAECPIVESFLFFGRAFDFKRFLDKFDGKVRQDPFPDVSSPQRPLAPLPMRGGWFGQNAVRGVPQTVPSRPLSPPGCCQLADRRVIMSTNKPILTTLDGP